VLTAVGALVVLPVSPAAYAGGSGSVASARSQAQRSAAKVKRLEIRLDAALAAYDTALSGLQQQVSAGLDAADATQASTAALQAAQDLRTQRVRAIYMDGGQLGIYASVLSSTSPQDLALRVMTAQTVVASADQSVSLAGIAVAQVTEAENASDQRINTALVSADDVTARANEVSSLVAQARAESAHLSAQARKLAEAQLAAATAAAAGAARSAAGSVGAMGIPAAYLGLYQAAARTCPGMDWTLLAAVGQIESGHGRNNGPSSAGAIGPMQFRPSTFDAYAVDGNHDGRLDPWNPADAIFTAAHFLCSYGAGSPSGVQRALLHYNNAQWYVDLVLAAQQRIAAAY
jgi:hypothetical protein